MAEWPPLSAGDCEATVRAFDGDGNGTLCYREFVEAICGTSRWRAVSQPTRRASIAALAAFSELARKSAQSSKTKLT